jgi:hypothetical protein
LIEKEKKLIETKEDLIGKNKDIIDRERQATEYLKLIPTIMNKLEDIITSYIGIKINDTFDYSINHRIELMLKDVAPLIKMNFYWILHPSTVYSGLSFDDDSKKILYITPDFMCSREFEGVMYTAPIKLLDKPIEDYLIKIEIN